MCYTHGGSADHKWNTLEQLLREVCKCGQFSLYCISKPHQLSSTTPMLHQMICFPPGWIRWFTVQTKPQYRGIINRYPHVGSAGKAMHVPFIPVPLYNKVNKNIQILKKKGKDKKKKRKKASWHCQLIPVVVLEILIL